MQAWQPHPRLHEAAHLALSHLQSKLTEGGGGDWPGGRLASHRANGAPILTAEEEWTLAEARRQRAGGSQAPAASHHALSDTERTAHG